MPKIPPKYILRYVLLAYSIRLIESDVQDKFLPITGHVRIKSQLCAKNNQQKRPGLCNIRTAFYFRFYF